MTNRRLTFCLFRAFPDPFRTSMQMYADRLIAGIRPLLLEHEEITDRSLDGVRVEPKLARFWDQYVRYQSFCKRFPGDVNHVVDPGYGHLVSSLPFGRSLVTFHDLTVVKIPSTPLRTRLSLRYSLRAIRRAALVIADSRTARDDFLSVVDFPPERVRVIHLGVDRQFRVLPNREEAWQQHGLPSRYILNVGHTLPYANVDAAIHVLHLLVKKHGIDIQLVKVGMDLTANHKSLVCRLGLEDRIQYRGAVPFGELPVLYNCAEALLYPVLYAGFGWPPLEAMACGTPVVCSNRGAVPEIAGDSAMLVDPEDHEAMASQVARMLTDRAHRQSCVARGLDWVRRYDWDETARQVLALYREVANA